MRDAHSCAVTADDIVQNALNGARPSRLRDGDRQRVTVYSSNTAFTTRAARLICLTQTVRITAMAEWRAQVEARCQRDGERCFRLY